MEEVRDESILFASLFFLHLHKTNSRNHKLSLKISSYCLLYSELVQIKKNQVKFLIYFAQSWHLEIKIQNFPRSARVKAT